MAAMYKLGLSTAALPTAAVPSRLQPRPDRQPQLLAASWRSPAPRRSRALRTATSSFQVRIPASIREA